ncbi:MAG: DUF177 domain-containing protein [Muribaculaceae bacterium]|nr:DUF177 domain-containing protein [Muribaculaceae bacterium]
MKLSISSLPFGKQEFNYHLDGDFFNEIEASEVRSGSVDVALSVNHRQEGIYELDFVCNGVITIPCDRCLDDMDHVVDTNYQLTVKMGDALDDSIDNVLVIPSSWRTLDLGPIVRDTVLLTIPMMHTHSPGECNEDMLGRLEEHAARGYSNDEDFETPPSQNETAEGGAIDPRWSALQQLIENKNNKK